MGDCNCEEFFGEKYFTVGGWNGWYDETAFRLDNEWHKELAEYLCCFMDMKGSRILDVGCALGNVVYWLNGIGVEAYGVDISRWATERAWISSRVRQADVAVEIPFEENFFDGIVSRDTLEHIPEERIDSAIVNLGRVMKKGGRAFVSVATNRGGKEEKKRSDPGKVDESHVLIRPLTWWRERFERSGFFSIDLDATFMAMNSGLGYKYGWDILILERT